MALRQMVGYVYNSEAKVFMAIRDFLSASSGLDDFSPSGATPGPGYDVIDESYASGDRMNTTSGDWCALRSRGESETYPHYLKLEFGPLQHAIRAYLGWDSNTHQGFCEVYNAANIYHNGAGNVTLYIHADLDECHIIIRPRGVSNLYWTAYGRLKPDRTAHSGVAIQAASAIADGSGVEIPLASWPDWAAPGKKIYNWSEKALQELTITAASESSGIITVESARGMAAGSWLAEDVFVFVGASHNSQAGSSATNSGLYGAPTRAVGSPTAPPDTAYFTQLLSLPGKDDKYEHLVASEIWAYRANEVRGRFGLARECNIAPTLQGEAWVDEEGAPWRRYTVYNGKHLAFRESV